MLIRQSQGRTRDALFGSFASIAERPFRREWEIAPEYSALREHYAFLEEHIAAGGDDQMIAAVDRERLVVGRVH